MKIAVLTCAAYRDCWKPFAQLFRKFWPQCPYPLWLVTDEGTCEGYDHTFAYPGNGADSWCKRLIEFAQGDDPILFFLEDFFLTAPVQIQLVESAKELLSAHPAGCVRLYPCPGSDGPSVHDNFGVVTRGAAYRISTMPAIWDAAYLRAVASQCDSPWSFEIHGTKISAQLPQEVLSVKRDVRPWPTEIMATGIQRGKWIPGAKQFLAEHGITVESDRPAMAEIVK